MTRPATPPSPATTPSARPAHGHHHARHHGTFHKHLAHATQPSGPDAREALHTAIGKEGVPTAWETSLRTIMEHESGGRVGVANTVDTARGLFQLTRASYHLNPNGAASFGNGVEEAQGGIRYIQQRYQTADNALTFWNRHGWY